MYPVMLGRLVGIDGVILSYRNIYMCCLYSFSFCAAFLDINFDRCDEYILYVHSDTLSKIKTRLCTRLRCFYMLRYFTVNFLQLCDTSIFSPPPPSKQKYFNPLQRRFQRLFCPPALCFSFVWLKGLKCSHGFEGLMSAASRVFLISANTCTSL